jgi:hypothetical protein
MVKVVVRPLCHEADHSVDATAPVLAVEYVVNDRRMTSSELHWHAVVVRCVRHV